MVRACTQKKLDEVLRYSQLRVQVWRQEDICHTQSVAGREVLLVLQFPEGKEDRVLSIRELSENAFHWLRGTCCDVRWHGHCFSGIIAEVGYKVVLH